MPGKPLEQSRDPFGGKYHAVGGVRGGEEEHLGLYRGHGDRRHLFPARHARQGKLRGARPRDGGEHGIQGVGGLKIGDGVPGVHERAHEHGEDLVGAVAAEDLVGVQAVGGRGAFPKGRGIGARIEPHGLVRCLPQGLEHTEGRGIGVLVRIQLHEPLIRTRLEPRHVAVHSAHGLADPAESPVHGVHGAECSRTGGRGTRTPSCVPWAAGARDARGSPCTRRPSRPAAPRDIRGCAADGECAHLDFIAFYFYISIYGDSAFGQGRGPAHHAPHRAGQTGCDLEGMGGGPGMLRFPLRHGDRRQGARRGRPDIRIQRHQGRHRSAEPVLHGRVPRHLGRRA